MYVRCSSQQVFKIKMWYSSLLHWWNSFPSRESFRPQETSHRNVSAWKQSNPSRFGSGDRSAFFASLAGCFVGREWWDVMWFWLREKNNNERSIILVIEVKRRWSETGGWVLPESNIMARPWKMVVLETTYSFWEGLLFRCYVSAREGSHEVFTIKWLWSESDTKW